MFYFKIYHFILLYLLDLYPYPLVCYLYLIDTGSHNNNVFACIQSVITRGFCVGSWLTAFLRQVYEDLNEWIYMIGSSLNDAVKFWLAFTLHTYLHGK